jgi:hypothetical protein
LPACIAANVVDMSPTKNWSKEDIVNINTPSCYANCATSLEDGAFPSGYKGGTEPEDERDGEKDHTLGKGIRALLQMALRFDRRRDSSKLSRYRLQQSSSRVNAATVRMAAAASQASCAEASCAFLFFWCLRTTIRYGRLENLFADRQARGLPGGYSQRTR